MGCCWRKISNTSEHIGGTSAWVEFEEDWFDEGASRRVFRGTFRGDSCTEGKPCVVKVQKHETNEDPGEPAWKAGNRAYLKAHEMAHLFNNEFNTSKPIEFVKPEITNIKTRAASILRCLYWLTYLVPSWLKFFLQEKEVKGKEEGTRDKVSNVIPEDATLVVERYLEQFAKFSGNTGCENPETGSSPSAFSHYTYHASDGEILICRLQGVSISTGYILTSPAIHSGGTELGVYGPTDLGKFGIAKFFKNHTCNVLCTGLKKPKLVTDPRNETELMDTIVKNMPKNQMASMNTHQLSDVTGVPLPEIEQAQCKFQLAAVNG